MSMLPDVQALLSASASVTALIGTVPDIRLYRHGEAPQDVEAPYCTWFFVTGNPENHLSGNPLTDRWEIQVDCWSDNDGNGDIGIETLGNAVRDAIEDSPYYITQIFPDSKNSESKRYRIGFTYTDWLDR